MNRRLTLVMALANAVDGSSSDELTEDELRDKLRPFSRAISSKKPTSRSILAIAPARTVRRFL